VEEVIIAENQDGAGAPGLDSVVCGVCISDSRSGAAHRRGLGRRNGPCSSVMICSSVIDSSVSMLEFHIPTTFW
jgi:hypothetical protein